MTKPIAKWANFVWPESETWLPVQGFSGYEVSDAGRIRSCRWSNARLRTPEIDKDGYARLTIRRDGQYVHVVLHRLVCQAFNGQASDLGMVCCHNDNDRTNNVPSNLRWDTQAGNIADKIKHGTHQTCEKHPFAKITTATASEVKRLFRAIPRYKGKLKFIANQTGASYSTVFSIVHNRTWSAA